MDLSGNNFQVITNYGFARAPNLLSLYLQNNQIYKIESFAFYGVNSLQILNLSNNLLTTLTKGTFDDLTDMHNGIYLDGNEWICDCSLEWLQYYLLESDTINTYSTPICNDTELEDIDFNCLETTTPSLEFSNTTAGSGGPSWNYVNITCRNLQFAPLIVNANVKRTYMETFSLRNNSLFFEFFEVHLGTPAIEIKISGDPSRSYLVWQNSKDRSDYGCVTNILNTIVMKHLTRNTIYTACLIFKNETMTSPYDCLGFLVPQVWEDRTWLTNKVIKPLIGLIAFSILFVAVISGFAVFSCVRRNPKLIAGNKRVIIVKNKDVDAIILPQGNSKKHSKDDSGYLTPNNPEVILNRRKKSSRSMSESSIISNTSYVNPENLDSNNICATANCNNNFTTPVIEHIYEKPPLPSNHPCGPIQNTKKY